MIERQLQTIRTQHTFEEQTVFERNYTQLKHTNSNIPMSTQSSSYHVHVFGPLRLHNVSLFHGMRVENNKIERGVRILSDVRSRHGSIGTWMYYVIVFV